MPSEAVPSPAAMPWPGRLSDYWELAKPGIAMSVLITTFAGFVLGSETGHLRWDVLAHTLFGTALVSFGAGSLNMLLEKDSDALMRRTQARPLPAGRLQPVQALALGLLCSTLGLVHLGSFAHPLASFMAAASLALYLVLYTPLKKVSSLCTVVGAISGALPPIIGWTAAGQPLNWAGGSLFLILFVWQFPHLLALAWLYREDYARGQFVMLPMTDESGSKTSRYALAVAILLLPVSWIPAWLGLAGKTYWAASTLLGLVQIAAAMRFALRKDNASARTLFFATIFYMPLLLAALIMS